MSLYEVEKNVYRPLGYQIVEFYGLLPKLEKIKTEEKEARCKKVKVLHKGGPD